MEREDRIGAWVSGLAHGALILWALLAGALFRANDPLPVETVQVGTMTDAEFQAMAAATRGPGPVADGAMRPPQALAQDQTADPAPEAPLTPTEAPPPAFGTMPPSLTDPDNAPQAPAIPAAPLSPLALEQSRLPRARPEGLAEAAQARAEAEAARQAEAQREAEAARLAALTAQREAEAEEAARIAATEAAAARQAEADRQAEIQRAAEVEAARQAEATRQAEAARQAETERAAAEAARLAEAEAARLEAQRREQERLAEQEQLEQERREQERLAEQARLEQERREQVAREEARRLADEQRREADRQEAERLEAIRLAEETQRQLDELAEAARRLEAEDLARQAETEAPPEDELTRALAEALAATPDADGDFTDPDALDDPDLPRGPRASGVPDDELTHSLDSARTAAPEPIPEDMLTSAIEGALADTPEAPSALAAAASDAPVLTSNELGVLMTHIGECWNISMLSMDAQDVVISVEVRLDRGGVPLPDSLRLVDWQGGSEAAAQNAFDVAARAIRSCGEQGLDLPADKYDRWKRLILDFDPRQMAARANG